MGNPLPVPVVAQWVPGPAKRVQLVIEIVGPRSVPGSAADQLLSKSWQSALGQPELFCMAPADDHWRLLEPGSRGAYDSIALCWDLISTQGELTKSSAQRLFTASEEFAKAVGRRAMPIPVPDDVSRTVRDLRRIQEQLDVGISIVVVAKSGITTESVIALCCENLALELSPGGTFDWRVPQHPSPLFSITPIGERDYFGPASDSRNCDGATIGFNVPRCPAPSAALDAALLAAEAVASATDGVVVDDSGRLLNAEVRDEMRRNLHVLLTTFDEIGIEPGSRSALKLFG